MTYKELLKEATDILASGNIIDCSIDAYLLLEYVFGMNKSRYYIHCEDNILDKELVDKYLECIKKRSEHIPLQHITNCQEFMGLDFYVDENVLCPRQDTEVLVEEAIKVIDSLSYSKENVIIKVLDMCTGSGCIAISIKNMCKDVHMTAVDLSVDALNIAKGNARRHNTEIDFLQSNLFQELSSENRYDIIVSNPPYIRTKDIEELMEEVKEHEPIMALDGDEDGLLFYKNITKSSKSYLKEGGILIYEIGYDQGKEVKAIMKDNGFDDIKVIKDLAGLDRVVKGINVGGNKSV